MRAHDSRYLHLEFKGPSADASAFYSNRPHAAADEVIVTGTFDNWAKSIKLDKKAWAHEKTVEIPDTKDEILYKVRSVAPCYSALHLADIVDSSS